MTTPISLTLHCLPPSMTAQQKRVRFRPGRRPIFFHSRRMRQQVVTWASLLAPFRPPAPMDGPIALSVRLIYPHLKATAKRDRVRLVPKISKPDVGNASKHLEDLLTRLGFLTDDARVARLVVEKFHGPAVDVGIRIDIRPFDPSRSTFVVE